MSLSTDGTYENVAFPSPGSGVTVTDVTPLATDAVYASVAGSNAAGVRPIGLSWVSFSASALSVASAERSSSTMVPVAVLRAPSAAFDEGVARVTVNVSSSSSSVSSVVAMVSVALVSPVPRVSVRLAAAV